MGSARLTESQVRSIAQRYADQYQIHEQIDRIAFVDINNLPARFREKGSFWVVVFKSTKQADVVVEHDGVVLNIGDADQLVSPV